MAEDALWVGSMPEAYERWLVPAVFHPTPLWGSRTWHLPLTSGDRPPPQTFRHDRRRVTAGAI